MKNKNGFTLIELMIVIAIIGILVAVGIPSYQQYILKAKYTEIVRAASNAKISVEHCYHMNGSLTDCVSGKNGIENTHNTSSDEIIKSIEVGSNGIITVTPNTAEGLTHQDTYVLTPVENHHRLTWEKSGGATQQGYV